MKRVKQLYKGIEDECNIEINIFTDGMIYVLDIFARSAGMYQYAGLFDGGVLIKPKKKSWW